MGEEWIEWKVGECPVPVGDYVDVKFRHGGVASHVLAGTMVWAHGKLSEPKHDIIAYRVVDQSK